jgi:hypothetical protein
LPLAGVLLGKTSLNSLYGLQAVGCRKLCHSFGYPDSARMSGLVTAPNE